MKRIIPFFAVCLGLSVFQTSVVIGAESTRTNIKRDTREITTVPNISTRQKSDKTTVETGRVTTGTKQVQNRTTPTNRSASKGRTNASSDTAQKKTVTRTRSANTPQQNISGRVPATRRQTVARATTIQSAPRTTARATELNTEKISAIKANDYSKCKSVYYDCMDEFCANKDTSLRRCSCSSRIHEFDDIKKQLSNAEDKMMNFNQRLLAVGLDKEDAAAISVATEGEIGYSNRDLSTSEKLLKKITDTLNSSEKSKINNDLAAISLSLDTDSAWDTIDSMSGISMTTKNGLDLYNAAQPICIEMAKEVCSDHELEITQSNYKLAIQQDCNTVAKSYDSKYNQAIEKIHESGALLDMARLNAYQQRNSDDILTCKKKILDKMSDSSVCGENLYKCLDITGKYIDPSTGNAFLSNDLYSLTSLLTAPTGNETWSSVPQNQQFISFLNSKKMFLESATEQCQDISDAVWKDFLDDALGQIKLAQNAKLEEIRQSCTTLVAECKSATQESLLDFDARALSTFEVIADTTTNAICADVESSCIALLNSSGGGASEWASGMTEIATDISYDAILKNCTTVGQDCIIQQCNGTAGNFALCGNFAAAPRRAILRHDACWNEVLNCVQQSSNLANMNIQNRNDFYNSFFGLSNINSIPNPCDNDDDKACLITEQIWGNCEHDAATTPITTNNNLSGLARSNKILIPTSDENTNLLSWLAYNTGTTDATDSCSAYNCPINYQYDANTKTCKRMITSTDTETSVGEPVQTMDEIFYVTSNLTNKCSGGIGSKDVYGNCCASGTVSDGICVPNAEYSAVFVQTVACDSSLELLNPPTYYCPDFNTRTITIEGVTYTYYIPTDDKQMALYCVTTTPATIGIDGHGNLNCDGYLILIDQYGNYIPPATITTNANNVVTSVTQLSGPYMSYKKLANTACKYTYSNAQWRWMSGGIECTEISGADVPTPKHNEFMITYPN